MKLRWIRGIEMGRTDCSSSRKCALAMKRTIFAEKSRNHSILKRKVLVLLTLDLWL